MRYKQISIIGVGLLGASIGLALKKKRLAARVVGIGRRKSSLKEAKRIGAIDRWTLDIDDGVRDADIVIIATPVNIIVEKARQVFKFAPSGVLVFDIGSVKEEIVAAVEKIVPRDKYFIGTHPMAGSEKRGAAFADDGLFKGCTVILTRTRKTKKRTLEEIKRFWKMLGVGNVEIISPQQHDKIVARVSHLPHSVASTTCLSIVPVSVPFTATGFKDTTRVASSVPELWADIFLMNEKNMCEVLDEQMHNTALLKGLIKKKDRRGLVRLLAKAKKIRDSVT